MPPIRPLPPPPDRDRTSRALADALAAPRVSDRLADLVRDVGGTRAAADLVGRSERTVRRWSAGDVQQIPAELRGRLVRAGSAARIRNLIGELGGPARVAELTGRSVRTVQRWAAGQISQPRRDARSVLNRADAAVRMRRRGLSVDPATGRPTSPIRVKMRGNIRVNSSRTTGYDYTGRHIGPDSPAAAGIEIDPDTIAAIVDALGRSDYRSAQETLEAFLSTNYAATGRYDAQANIGLFIDQIQQVTFDQDPPDA